MLAIGIAARVRRELQGSADAAIIFRLKLLASIVFNNNHSITYSLSLHAAMQNVHHDNYNVCIKAISSFILPIYLWHLHRGMSEHPRCFH